MQKKVSMLFKKYSLEILVVVKSPASRVGMGSIPGQASRYECSYSKCV